MNRKAATGVVVTLCMMAFGLVACSDPKTSYEYTVNYNLPPQMQHCKVYSLTTKNGAGGLTVVHCPGDQVVTQSGKQSVTVIEEGSTINGSTPNVNRMEMPENLQQPTPRLL